LRTENQKIYKLKTPFVKFESICKQYKPIYEEFAAWHELNVEFSTVKKICSPFQIYFDDDVSTDCSSSSQVERNESNATTKTASNRPLFKSPTSSTATRPTNRSTVLNKTNTTTNPAVKKPTGYCESCKQRFDNLKQVI
jgi:7-cyano-7-deazaguanine synthase in queuosine biosynthesis